MSIMDHNYVLIDSKGKRGDEVAVYCRLVGLFFKEISCSEQV